MDIVNRLTKSKPAIILTAIFATIGPPLQFISDLKNIFAQPDTGIRIDQRGAVQSPNIFNSPNTNISYGKTEPPARHLSAADKEALVRNLELYPDFELTVGFISGDSEAKQYAQEIYDFLNLNKFKLPYLLLNTEGADPDNPFSVLVATTTKHIEMTVGHNK